MNKQHKRRKAAVSGIRTLRRRLTLLAVSYAIATLILTAIVWQLRVNAIVSGEKVLETLAYLTEEQTTRTIQIVELTLEIAEQRLASAARLGAISEEAIGAEFSEILTDRPYMNAIAVLDRQGRSIYRSDGAAVGVDLSDREYFVRQRDHPEERFQLGAPIRTRVTGQWIVPATRTWRGANGEILGVIVGSIRPGYFDKVWIVDKSIQDQATALWRKDGVVLIRSPFDERAMGTTLDKGLIISRIRSGSVAGTFRTNSLVDGVDRLVAYRQLSAYPDYSLSVTRSAGGVLAAWYETAWLGAIGWVIASAALGWLAVELTREGYARRATQDRYRVLFKANAQPMLVADQKTLRFLAINDAALRQYGWSRDELFGMTANDLYIPEDLPAVTALRKQGGPGVNQSAMILRQRRKDGTVFHVEMSIRLIDFEGKPAFLAAAQDVTRRLAVEEQLRQSQKMETIGQLIGGVAHDFNNILMVILSNVDALQEENTLGTRVADHITQIEQAAERASLLTSQLLSFSGKQPLRPQRTDLNELVVKVGKLLRRILGEQIEIESILADDLCLVNIDHAQLQTSLVNLCLNARDAMPNGGRLLIETCNVLLDDDYVALNPGSIAGTYASLTVSDIGHGIRPEVLTKVFDPFFTTKDFGKGSGLGLSMVHGFIAQSKGYISITSELGRGTSVIIYLPSARGILEAEAVERETPALGGDERILVVEDEPPVRASVVQQLRSLGYIVSEASDGDVGIAAFAAAEFPLDLLLTDIVMPGSMNGKALAHEVKMRWPKTKVVFMSGYTESTIIHDGQLDAGVFLLSKPFRKADLARIVRRALDGVDQAQDRPAMAIMKG